jgi:transcriptional regulator with XRE-family HTH domain
MCGTEIKSLRTQRGWTQRELADRLGLAPNHVAQLERNQRRVRRVVEIAIRAVCT